MSRKNSIKVKVRVQAARAAGRWFVDELAKHPGLEAKFGPGTVAFFTGLARRSSATLELDRGLAERLVKGWRAIFRAWGRNDLRLAVEPDERAPRVAGPEAIAEIINDLGAALRMPEGRPWAVDPLEAAEAVERARGGRKRGKGRAVEIAAAELGVGVTALEKAATKGRRARAQIEAGFAADARGSKKVP